MRLVFSRSTIEQKIDCTNASVHTVNILLKLSFQIIVLQVCQDPWDGCRSLNGTSNNIWKILHLVSMVLRITIERQHLKVLDLCQY